MAKGPVLVGVDGFVAGEEHSLEYGSTVVIGRSRSCEVSLQRAGSWLALSPEERDAAKDFKTVSRKHARVSYYNANSIEVEDLSSNGTFVNGKRIKRLVITDLRERDYDVLLGTRERFRLEWRHDTTSAEARPTGSD